MTKKVIVRWTAVYETEIEVPADAHVDDIVVKEAAANIDLDVPGSTYQTDTWEVEEVRETKS